MSAQKEDWDDDIWQELEEFFQTGIREEEPIPIHELTLKEFIYPAGRKPMIADEEFCKGQGAVMAMRAFYQIQMDAKQLWKTREPSTLDQFTIASTGNNDSGVICLWHEQTGELVGGLAQCIPYVKPEWRGNKLGREIDLRAFETGIKRPEYFVYFSPQGIATRFSTHKYAIERALQKGIAVSDEVLSDYPDLKNKNYCDIE